MRTTVNLDDEVTAAVEKLRRERQIGLSEAVNELVHAGLVHQAQEAKRRPFVQKAYPMGEPLIPLDNIAEVLDYLDGFDDEPDAR